LDLVTQEEYEKKNCHRGKHEKERRGHRGKKSMKRSRFGNTRRIVINKNYCFYYDLHTELRIYDSAPRIVSLYSLY